MGMGEPLDNFSNLIKAIQIFNSPYGIKVGARKITVSTCGMIPEIKKLAKLEMQVELSISLHATNNKLRNKLVPINKKYPLGELFKTCKDYHKKTNRVITLEYTLMPGENDSYNDATNLSKIAKELNAKINLINCNIVAKEEKGTVNKRALRTFRDLLKKDGCKVTIRQSKGDEIAASCGQLAAEKRKT